MSERRRDTAGVIAPPPLIYLAALGVGAALEAFLPSVTFPALLRWVGGGAFLVAGGALMGSFVLSFRRAGTAVDPSRPSTALVTTGPYRITRNPGYLGLAAVSIGIALMTSAVWLLATLPFALIVIDRGVIAREERYLERRFGDEYAAYRSRTRRWL